MREESKGKRRISSIGMESAPRSHLSFIGRADIPRRTQRGYKFPQLGSSLLREKGGDGEGDADGLTQS